MKIIVVWSMYAFTEWIFSELFILKIGILYFANLKEGCIFYKKAVVLLAMLIMYRLWEPKTYKVAPYDQNLCPEELS